MKQTICKFPLQMIPRQEIALPFGACVLSVQMQRESICVWAMVDPARQTEPRTFLLIATGEEFDTEGLHYVGTVQPSPFLVFHLFESNQ